MFLIQETAQSQSDKNPAADVATALRDRFGDDALTVAQKQHDVAEYDQLSLWRGVIDHLSK